MLKHLKATSTEIRRRRVRALGALKTWRGLARPDEADARDLIADLLHLLDGEGRPTHAELDRAVTNWANERERD